jgi:hypothetical protein
VSIDQAAREQIRRARDQEARAKLTRAPYEPVDHLIQRLEEKEQLRRALDKQDVSNATARNMGRLKYLLTKTREREEKAIAETKRLRRELRAAVTRAERAEDRVRTLLRVPR